MARGPLPPCCCCCWTADAYSPAAAAAVAARVPTALRSVLRASSARRSTASISSCRDPGVRPCCLVVRGVGLGGRGGVVRREGRVVGCPLCLGKDRAPDLRPQALREQVLEVDSHRAGCARVAGNGGLSLGRLMLPVALSLFRARASAAERAGLVKGSAPQEGEGSLIARARVGLLKVAVCFVRALKESRRWRGRHWRARARSRAGGGDRETRRREEAKKSSSTRETNACSK